MPNMLDGFEPPAFATESKPALYKCEWKICPGKVHEKKPEYGKGSTKRGDATSGDGYREDWINNKMQPWQLHGKGKYNADKIRKANEKHADNKYPEYRTQAHHLISVKLFDSVPNLAKNAELVKYNVNDKENGIMLPRYTIDIVQHNLQRHCGSHAPMYNENVSKFLKNLQDKSQTWCKKNLQEFVKRSLEMYSLRIKQNIQDWKNGWLLNHGSRDYQKEAYDRIGKPVPK